MQSLSSSYSQRVFRILRHVNWARASCGTNNSAQFDEIFLRGVPDFRWVLRCSMGTLNVFALSSETHHSSEVLKVQSAESPALLQAQGTRSAPRIDSTTGAKMSCASNLRALVLPTVNNLRTVTDRPNAVASSNCLTSGRYVIKFGGNIMRYRVPGEAVATVAASNSRGSSTFSKSRCLSCSRHSLVGSRIHNEGWCSTALEADRATARFRSKEGNSSNVGRLKASADSEFVDNLEAALEVSRVGKFSPLSAGGFISPVVTGGVPELRLIHATAVVHPNALVGEGVEIGPFCTVGPKVKLGNDCKLHAGSHIFGETQLGEGCVLLTGAVVGADIPGNTIIGDGNIIGHHAVVGVKCQDMKYKEGDECFLHVGNKNDIREFSSIHRSSKPNDYTIIGNDNLIMGSCHIAHDCKIGNGNILANGTLLGGHVVVEDLVHTGGAVAVHQFCNIGSYSFLAGGSMVERDVPKFMMVAGDRAELRGLNLEGMRRCGFSIVEVRSIRKAYQKLFMNSDSNGGGMEERLSELEQNEELSSVPAVSLMLQSVRDCFGEQRRGICRFRHWTTV